MKVSFIIKSWSDDSDACLVGGSAKSPTKVVREVEKRLEVPFVTYFDGTTSTNDNYTYHRVRYAKLYLKTLVQTLVSTVSVYRSFRYSDIVQCHHPHFGLFSAILRRYFFRNRSFIVKAHGTAVPELRANGYTGVRQVLLYLNSVVHRWHDRFVLESADVVLCSSKYQELEMVNVYGVAQAKLRTIYNGYDSSYFFPCGESDSNSNSFLKDDSTLDIVFCGRVVPKKGASYAIAVASHLCELGYRVRLNLILGSEAYIEDTATLAEIRSAKTPQELSILEYFDLSESELANTIRASDFAIVPSRNYESIPSVVYEFAACGIPVFATYQWGIPEVLNSEYALTGDLVNDSSRILKTIHNVSTPSVSNIDRYSYGELVKEYIDVYRQLV